MSPVQLHAVDSDPDPEIGLVLNRADLSRAAPPRWAWEHRIVLGYLNLLLGNEGVGKGTLIAWLIARLTRGEIPGDLRGRPISVGVLGDEDSLTMCGRPACTPPARICHAWSRSSVPMAGSSTCARIASVSHCS